MAEVCPLPKTSGRLLELTRSDRASIPDVAKVIVTDPALASSVLRIANSAAYGGRNIDTLEAAVMRIGLKELHDMAAAMSLFAAFRNRGELLVAFHDRAVVSGAVSHRLAKAFAVAQPSVAFTCGLLSEIGAMACLSVEGKEYTELYRSVEHSPLERCAKERERYGASSYYIGGRFLARNHLPENISAAVATEVDADLEGLGDLPRLSLLSRLSAAIMLKAGKSGNRAEALESLEALPEALRGPGITSMRLFELCLEAGATAEQTLRMGR